MSNQTHIVLTGKNRPYAPMNSVGKKWKYQMTIPHTEVGNFLNVFSDSPLVWTMRGDYLNRWNEDGSDLRVAHIFVSIEDEDDFDCMEYDRLRKGE